MKTNVLIVGSGGREHAIAWKISQSAEVGRTVVAPGNGGTKELNVQISSTDIDSLCKFAKENNCLTIVGPEAPLERGLVDKLDEAGLCVFGPTREQAMLETSKAFSKNFMRENQIPTADFKIFSSPDDAIAYADSKQGNIVVKADGLASGKGVVVCSNKEEATNAIREIMVERVFGQSGSTVVLEEKLRGRELSLMAICDGKDALPFGTAVDHKRLLEGDLGPNTGGMGAYSPADGFGDEAIEAVMEGVVRRAVRKIGFRGFLYTGLILTKDGPKVLEFNARLGDPEAEVILPRLESDLLSLIETLCGGARLDSFPQLKWASLHSCAVVMCSQGYPRNVKMGAQIRGLEQAKNDSRVTVFHSGSSFENGKLVTSGGRVICVTALDRSLEEAASTAYQSVAKISWEGEFHRQDIAREKKDLLLYAE
ncbi:MAG: phosphoribosylamine--glycine ligase [Nitrososphaerales archaeon]